MNDGTHTCHALFLHVNFGFTPYIERLLKLSKSVKWISTCQHFTGLHEYLVHIPIEVARLSDLELTEVGVLECLRSESTNSADAESLYLIRPHYKCKAAPPKQHLAVCVGAVVEVGNSPLSMYPEIQNSLFRIETP